MSKTIVAGLDVGKNASYLVAWDAETPINNPKDFFEYEAEFICLFPDLESVNKIIALKPPDGRLVVFMEPTGSYSKLWRRNLEEAGIETHFVSHNLVNSSRLALCNWSDKDDEHDAVVLLILAQKWLNNPASVQLVRTKDPVIQELWDLYLNSEACNDVLNQLLNRARGKLHDEFSECDDIRSEVGKDETYPHFWAWIAGEKVPASVQNKYGKRLATSIGSAAKKGFSKQLVAYAKSICDWKLHLHQIETKMREILKDSRFARYLRIFKQFGAGLDTQVVWLCQIFPFERFLDSDRQPIIKLKKRGTKSGKPTKAHISCRKFHSCMGMAPNQRNSGDKKGEIITGSGACRMSLWRLVHARIETNSPSSLRNKFGKILRKFLDTDKNHRDELMIGLLTILADKNSGSQAQAGFKKFLLEINNPLAESIAAGIDKKIDGAKSGSIKKQVKFALIRLSRMRCAARLVKLLFKQLVLEFCKEGAPSAEESHVDQNGVPVYLAAVELARRVGKSRFQLYSLRRKLGDELGDAIAQLDPDGYRWKYHERRFYYSIAPGAIDDGGAIALSLYD